MRNIEIEKATLEFRLLSDGHERAERAYDSGRFERPTVVHAITSRESRSWILRVPSSKRAWHVIFMRYGTRPERTAGNMHLFFAAFWLLPLFSIKLLRFLILLAHFFSLISVSLLHILFHLT